MSNKLLTIKWTNRILYTSNHNCIKNSERIHKKLLWVLFTWAGDFEPRLGKKWIALYTLVLFKWFGHCNKENKRFFTQIMNDEDYWIAYDVQTIDLCLYQ